VLELAAGAAAGASKSPSRRDEAGIFVSSLCSASVASAGFAFVDMSEAFFTLFDLLRASSYAAFFAAAISSLAFSRMFFRSR
jgi:hypothetical protein